MNIEQVVQEGTKVVMSSLSSEVDTIVERLSATIIGQEQAKFEIANSLSDSLHQIVKKNWPISVMLFAWPTGTGKSESVRALANILLWDRDKVVKMNGEQFQEAHTASRLFGSPPWYIGYKDKPILEELSDHQEEAMASKTVSRLVKRLGGLNILLIDEVEKVHPRVLQSLLAVFDDGSCKLANGKEVILTSTLIICTSNIWEQEKRESREKPSMGFTPSKVGDDTKIFENSMKMFSPEFQGRIDSIVHFNSLTNNDALAIVDKLTKQLNDELYVENSLYTDLSLLLTENCKQFIIKKGFSVEKGARELNRTFKRMIDSPLWRILSQNDEINSFPQYKVKIEADEVDGKIEFSINPKDIEEITKDIKNEVSLILYTNK